MPGRVICKFTNSQRLGRLWSDGLLAWWEGGHCAHRSGHVDSSGTAPGLRTGLRRHALNNPAAVHVVDGCMEPDPAGSCMAGWHIGEVTNPRWQINFSARTTTSVEDGHVP